MSSGQEIKRVVATYMPTYGEVHAGAAKAYYAEMTKDPGTAVLRIDPEPNSNMAHGFNKALCAALNARAQHGVGRFAMLHADLQPDAWWLDILNQEMDRTGAQFLSVVAPIKNGSGVSSTAVSRGNRWNPWFRLTMKEIYGSLPETFCIDDIGDDSDRDGFTLLLNTGCMLLDLTQPWWDEVGDGGVLAPHFDLDNRIVFIPGRGYVPQTEPEDWRLSRILNEKGAKLYATRKVGIIHHGGSVGFDNKSAWGDWTTDQAGDRMAAAIQAEQKRISEAIHPHGYWTEDLPDGALHDKSLINAVVQLVRSSESKRVYDFGCGRGWFVEAIKEQLPDITVYGFDGNPQVEELGEEYHVIDLAEPLKGDNLLALLKPSDLSICIEVGEHIPAEYMNQFLNNLCSATGNLLVMSWAVDGQIGHGHVNCMSNEDVEGHLLKRGFVRNVALEVMLRAAATELPYFRDTVMVYNRPKPFAVAEPQYYTTESGEPGLVSFDEVVEKARNASCACPCDHTYKAIPETPNAMYTYADLMEASVALADKLPAGTRAVIGIEQKGMVTASIVGNKRHLPVYPLEAVLSRGMAVELSGDTFVALIDDGYGSGTTMDLAIQKLWTSASIPMEHVVRGAAYFAGDQNRRPPGLHVGAYIDPMFFQEHEFLNHGAPSMASTMVDLDGVLCPDWETVSPQYVPETDDVSLWARLFEWARPLYLPRKNSVRAIVTGRLERYRKVTEGWLQLWGVLYEALYMHPHETVVARDRDPESHGVFKGRLYAADPGAHMFIESSLAQARVIAEISRKPVFSVEGHVMLGDVEAYRRGLVEARTPQPVS